MNREVSPVKKMAELLKSGATMLAETCPVEGCRLPLFKLKTGEVVCPTHGRIHVVKTDEEALKIREELTIKTILDKLEEVIIKHIDNIVETSEINTHELINLLEILERIQRVKNQLKSSSKTT